MNSTPPIFFKDWLPDQPAFGNPGLTEAQNTLCYSGTYASYRPLNTFNPAITTSSAVSIIAIAAGKSDLSQYYVYAGTQEGKVFRNDDWPTTNYGGSLGAVSAMLEFDGIIYAADGASGLYSHTVGSSTTFGALSGSPTANVLGRVGQFLFAGNIKGTPNRVRWSSIDAPGSWPTPDSTTAIAQQSGEQDLHLELGKVKGIYGGDQWGVILQENGVTRVTYVAGDVVFQFDTFARGIGMDFDNSGVRIGNTVYFVSRRGFYATDGVQVIPIGQDKVNLWFYTNVTNDSGIGLRAAVDYTHKLIYWAFPPSGGGTATLVIYNYEQNRFTHAADANLGPMVGGSDSAFATYGLQAFGQDKKLGTFTGTPGTATFATGEAEPNPGEYTYISGIKALADATAAAISGSILYRNDLQASVTTANALTANSRTGYMDIRQNARYVRTQIAITGTFNAAQGVELKVAPGGMT